MIEYNGIYRGTVVYNIDPDTNYKIIGTERHDYHGYGKCKIFVHGIYPDEFFKDWHLLPWAEPAMAIGGGAWTNENGGLNKETGWCSAPHMRKNSRNWCTSICIF